MVDVRTQAAQILGSLLRHQGSLASLLPLAATKLNVRDRPLLQQLCFGVCRWHPRLNAYLDCLLQKPLRGKDADVQALLLLGLYQLLYLRVPDHAALNATVAAAQDLKKPWAKKLINGVLRNFLRQREALEQQLQDNPSFLSAHPPWLVDALTEAWPSQIDDIIAENNCAPPFTIRVNQQQFSRTDYEQQLQARDIEASATPFSETGLTLATPIPVDQLPGFNQGAVSVQDEAPQLAAELLRCNPRHRVLDACCAPGGKTAHLLEQAPGLSLVGVDISQQRIQRTRDNLQRLSLQTELIVGDAGIPSTWWDGKPFDRILVDVPCSATGIIRRQPDIKILRGADSIAKLVDNQRRLLTALWPLLKRGGELLYATCSILPAENSHLITNFILDQHDAEHLTISARWGMEQQAGRQLLPQHQGHDGFYFARLTKV